MNTPEEAIKAFRDSRLDALMLGNRLLLAPVMTEAVDDDRNADSDVTEKKGNGSWDKKSGDAQPDGSLRI